MQVAAAQGFASTASACNLLASSVLIHSMAALAGLSNAVLRPRGSTITSIMFIGMVLHWAACFFLRAVNFLNRKILPTLLQKEKSMSALLFTLSNLLLYWSWFSVGSGVYVYFVLRLLLPGASFDQTIFLRKALFANELIFVNCIMYPKLHVAFCKPVFADFTDTLKSRINCSIRQKEHCCPLLTLPRSVPTMYVMDVSWLQYFFTLEHTVSFQQSVQVINFSSYRS